jgi:hypothetical protein
VSPSIWHFPFQVYAGILEGQVLIYFISRYSFPDAVARPVQYVLLGSPGISLFDQDIFDDVLDLLDAGFPVEAFIQLLRYFSAMSSPA